MRLLQRLREPQKGFILPTILLISVGMFIIGLALVQTTTSSQAGLESQYVSLLAREAADGGVQYANYCYGLTSSQTWGSSGSGNLTQQTDCSGTVCNGSNTCNGTAGQTQKAYYASTKNYRTSFSVGNITPRANGALLITSIGTVNEVASGNQSTVLRSYSYTQRQIFYNLAPKASVSASGSYKTCAIVSNELYCWGWNSDHTTSGNYTGNLGNGNAAGTNKPADSVTPVKVSQFNNVLLGHIPTAVVSADYHSCAIADGDAYCWGMNTSGQLGNGSAASFSSSPVKVSNTAWGGVNGQVKSIGADGSTTCVVAGTTNKIYCWGDNTDGTVGQNSNAVSFYNTPQLVKDQSNGVANGLPSGYSATAMHLSGSSAHNMCAIANGLAYCWGKNDHGQIGDNTTVDRYAPTAVYTGGVLSGKTVTAISVDGVVGGVYAWPHACVIASGNVYCWGNNTAIKYNPSFPLSLMGNGDTTTADYLVPTSPTTTGVLSGLTMMPQGLNVGERHTCVLATNQKMYCWGANSTGELGNTPSGTTYDSKYPVQTYEGGSVGALNFTAIGGGSNRACGIANYKTYCWGNNNVGQIGDGTSGPGNNRSIPTLSLFLQPPSTYFLF